MFPTRADEKPMDRVQTADGHEQPRADAGGRHYVNSREDLSPHNRMTCHAHAHDAVTFTTCGDMQVSCGNVNGRDSSCTKCIPDAAKLRCGAHFVLYVLVCRTSACRTYEQTHTAKFAWLCLMIQQSPASVHAVPMNVGQTYRLARVDDGSGDQPAPLPLLGARSDTDAANAPLQKPKGQIHRACGCLRSARDREAPLVVSGTADRDNRASPVRHHVSFLWSDGIGAGRIQLDTSIRSLGRVRAQRRLACATRRPSG